MPFYGRQGVLKQFLTAKPHNPQASGLPAPLGETGTSDVFEKKTLGQRWISGMGLL